MSGARTFKLAPSILTADFTDLAGAIRAAEEGGADLLHLDVMDGRFVPNLTFGPLVIAAIRRITSLPLDVHLMIEQPEQSIAAYAAAGANHITIHAEACVHLHRAVGLITEHGCTVGVAINPATPVESLREIVPFLDLVLVMTVNPGFGGQRFIETSTSKIRRTRRLLDELNPTCDLQADGGINVSTLDDVAGAGANLFVVGSAVYNDQAPVAENLATLRQILRAYR
jgi:ribulose-phosphate 3-epimerase